MKILKRSLIWAISIASIIAALNIPVSTRQGINFIVSSRKIPLYVKLCGFLYRDYEYKDLSRTVTSGIRGDAERVTAVYEWTINNVRQMPPRYPVVDDHIWNIIVRGYGTADQMSDVFATLASYAGYEAFWEKLYARGGKNSILLSFVKIGNGWKVFDVAGHRCFVKKEDMAEDGLTYGEYLEGVDPGLFVSRVRRADKQKVFGRIVGEMKGFYE